MYGTLTRSLPFQKAMTHIKARINNHSVAEYFHRDHKVLIVVLHTEQLTLFGGHGAHSRL